MSARRMLRSRKALCLIVDCLVCSMMIDGRNNGKKMMTVRIVNLAFEIIHSSLIRIFFRCTLMP